MCLDGELLAAECARAGLEHQMEGVFCVDAQSTELRAMDLLGVGDSARLVAIAIEGEAAQFGGRDVYGVPFEDN